MIIGQSHHCLLHNRSRYLSQALNFYFWVESYLLRPQILTTLHYGKFSSFTLKPFQVLHHFQMKWQLILLCRNYFVATSLTGLLYYLKFNIFPDFCPTSTSLAVTRQVLILWSVDFQTRCDHINRTCCRSKLMNFFVRFRQ